MYNQTVIDLQEVVGEQITMDLIEYFGGVGLSIPQKITRSHALCYTVGYRYAKLLVEHFGGKRLELPSERNYIIEMRRQRDHKICTRFKNGDSIRFIASEFGLSRKAVQNILDKYGVERPGKVEQQGSQITMDIAS